jgi:hypothetical protein
LNKTAVVLGYLALMVFGMIGAVVILLFKPDSFGVLTSFILTVLALASTFTVLVYGLGKQDAKLDAIKTQTNGINTALREENAKLHEDKAALTAQLLAVVSNAPPSEQEKP